jgi:hypothetical protein
MTDNVRLLAERIEGEARHTGLDRRQAAALVWLAEGREQNNHSPADWAAAMTVLHERAFGEAGMPTRLIDTSEVGASEVRAPGKPAPKYFGAASTGPYDGGPRLGVGAGDSRPTNLGKAGTSYGSEAMETLVADRMRELEASGRPADRPSVLRELVNKGAVQTYHDDQSAWEAELQRSVGRRVR